ELKDELGSLGGSVYVMGSFECFIQEGCFMNHREIKDLRKELVEKMNLVRTTPKGVVVKDAPEATVAPHRARTKLNILLRKRSQVEGLINAIASGTYQGLSHNIGSVILDFEFGKDYGPSVELVRAQGLPVAIATTRI